MVSPSAVSYFHLCGLDGEEEEKEKEKNRLDGMKMEDMMDTKGRDGVLYLLRPVRVGVEGSTLGFVLKVTLFPGVRANSFAMYMNTKPNL